MEDKLKRKESESKLAYFKRITDNKTIYDLDYSEWGELIVGEKKYSSENCRKAYYMIKPLLAQLDLEEINKLPKNKIDEVSELIGELDVKKMEVKNKTSQLNKIKRNFVKSIEISNDIKECLLENIDNFPKFDYEMIQSNDNKLLINLGDIHVGYCIENYNGNYYNYEIAKRRLERVISETKKYCDTYNITDVYIVNLGDVVENCYMRNTNQAYECEFNFSEQIVKATQLLFGFANAIAEFANVEFYSVGGNHNRLSQKDMNIEGDNVNVIINENLKTFIDLSENKRIHINDIDYKDDSVAFTINNTKIKAFHGDNRVMEEKKLYDSECSIDHIEYDLILRGHFHNFKFISQNNGIVLTNGCLFGGNPYSVKRMGCFSKASQSIVVIGSNGIENIKNIEVQEII